MKLALILDWKWEVDGYDPSQVIALTFAEAKFNNLVTRGGTLSTPIKLAKTANNTRIFGFPDENRERSARPYTAFDCQVRVSDQPLFYGVAVLEESRDFYELRIFGAVTDFFKIVGDKSIRDLDLSSFNHAWTAVNVFAETDAVSDYCYPAINYGRWTGTKASRAHTDFFPAVYFKTLLERAASEEGWTLNNYLSGWGIPFSLQDYENEKGCLFEVETTADETINYKTGGGAVIGPQILSDNFDQVNNDPTSHATDVSSTGTVEAYKVKSGGAYDFKALVKYDTGGALTGNREVIIEIGYVDVNGAPQSQNFATTVLDSSSPTTGIIELNAYGVQGVDNRYATIIFTVQEPGVPGGANFSIDIDTGTSFSCESGREPYLNGDTINIADTLPDIKIKDLFLFEAVRRNALIVANAQEKTLEFVDFDDIAGKWGNAYDWTSKIDITKKPKYEFRLDDFAQENLVKWKDGTDEDPAYKANNDLGNYTLTVDDGGLPLEKTMYTAPFAATVQALSFTDNFHARILRYSSSSLAYDAPDINPEPRAMPLINRTTNLVQITSGGGTVTSQQMGEPETWSEIAASNWGAFIALLSRLKRVTVDVHLSAEDIQKLDFTRPVRLLENYWFIQEVKQWKANKAGVTEVKLLRL